MFCRLINELTAVLQQTAPSVPISAATAPAASAHSDASVTLEAACCLALFFPQRHLLTLTQTTLSCVQPAESHPDSSTEASRQSQVAKLGTHLAGALIRRWTEQKNEGVAVEEPHSHAAHREEEWGQGQEAAWGDIVKGLLRTALSGGRAASGSPELSADGLLLKTLCIHTAPLDRLAVRSYGWHNL